VEVVAPGFSAPVDEHRWEEFWEAVGGDADFPPGAVQEQVVVGAHQDEVGEVGGSAVGPVADVVSLAVAGWSVAAGESAAAVAQVQSAAESGRDQAAEATEVERFALVTEDGGDEHAVAGVHPGFGSGHLTGVAESRCPHAGLQVG
jgi:hypothetical protein